LQDVFELLGSELFLDLEPTIVTQLIIVLLIISILYVVKDINFAIIISAQYVTCKWVANVMHRSGRMRNYCPHTNNRANNGFVVKSNITKSYGPQGLNP
jgi:hypothetical protein